MTTPPSTSKLVIYLGAIAGFIVALTGLIDTLTEQHLLTFIEKNFLSGSSGSPSQNSNYTLYKNDDYGFGLKYPSNWDVEEINEIGSFFCEREIVKFSASSNFDNQSIVISQCQDNNIDQVLNSAVRQIVLIQTGKQVADNQAINCSSPISINQSQLNCKSTRIDGKSAFHLDFMNPQNNLQYQEYIVGHKNSTYLLTYKADPNSEDDYRTIIKSFQLK